MEYISAKKVKQSLLNDLITLILLKSNFENDILNRRSVLFDLRGGCQKCYGKRENLKLISDNSEEENKYKLEKEICSHCLPQQNNFLNYKFLGYHDKLEFLDPITKPITNKIFLIETKIKQIEKQIETPPVGSIICVKRGTQKSKIGKILSRNVKFKNNKQSVYLQVLLENNKLISCSEKNVDLLLINDRC
jgi:hypothetical protein